MITDQIERHEVLLPIITLNKICDIVGSFLNQNTRNLMIFFFASSEKKKTFKCARDGAYCPFKLL